MPAYWIDTSVFIECKNRVYPIEMFPQVWAYFSEQFKNGTCCCLKKVYGELVKGNDWLAGWVKNRKADGLCISPPDQAQTYVGDIANHAYVEYGRVKSEEFLDGADPWVIAQAKCDGGTVVTFESSSRKKKVPIPLVCRHFKVRCITIHDMLKEMNARFGNEE